MKNIFYKKSKKFDELYDVFDDETVDEIEKLDDSFEVVDYDKLYDALQQGERPVYEDNLYDYLADEHLEEDEISIEDTPEDITEDVIEEPESVIEDEVGIDYEEPDLDEDIPIEGDIFGAIKYAIDNKKVVRIEYAPQGKKSGRGRKLKREIGLPSGSLINRIIEPHYMFRARTTGNDIVVTWDRSVREIRAYIVNNIKNYSFLDRKPFKIRNRILSNSNIGIKQMDNIKDKLEKVSKSLHNKGMTKTSSIIKNFDKALEDFKLAQYVGIQGYWIRNRRCWDNCYRNKRTTSPEKPAQIVWEECWDEYKKSINDDKSGWEKYADSKKIDLNKEYVKKWDKLFFEKVENKIKKEGMSKPSSIYATIEEESNISSNNLIDETSNLIKLCSDLKEKGFEKEAEKIEEIIEEVVKEAGIKDFFSAAKKKISGLFNWINNKLQSRHARNVANIIIEAVNDINRGLYNPNNKLQTFVQRVNRLHNDLMSNYEVKDSISQNIINKSVPVIQEFYTYISDKFIPSRQRSLQRQQAKKSKEEQQANIPRRDESQGDDQRPSITLPASVSNKLDKLSSLLSIQILNSGNKGDIKLSSEFNEVLLKIAQEAEIMPQYKQLLIQAIQKLTNDLSNVLIEATQYETQKTQKPPQELSQEQQTQQTQQTGQPEIKQQDMYIQNAIEGIKEYLVHFDDKYKLQILQILMQDLQSKKQEQHTAASGNVKNNKKIVISKNR